MTKDRLKTMGCDCDLEATTNEHRRVLVTVLAVNATMFIVEIFLGIIADSSGVLADSLDMLADALVYAVSLYAIGRTNLLKVRAARVAGIFQLLLGGAILIDVVRRALFGSEPHSALMMAVSVVALLANAFCLSLLHKHRDGEVHMRASWIFTRTDVIANLGVVLAALFVHVTQSRWPDLLIGAAIVCIVIKGGFQILAESKARS